VKQSISRVASNEELLPGVYLMWIDDPDIASMAGAGQFVTLRCEGLILRRPFAVHQANPGQVAILFRAVGEGTRWLSRRRRGDWVDVLGPLGNGFSIGPDSGNLLLLAGGIGIAPLVLLAQRASAQHGVTLIHGAATGIEVYPIASVRGNGEELRPLADRVRFIEVTEDGSRGLKGLVSGVATDFLDWADQVYACGPVDMYKAISQLATGCGAAVGDKIGKCQVSLEVRMGCGIGACRGCTVITERGAKRVCSDGPVFELSDILWSEVRL
jgi:dihydroorotate dehydrogenase electron transfer subunit